MVLARLSVVSNLLYWNSFCWHLDGIRAIARPVSIDDKPCVYYPDTTFIAHIIRVRKALIKEQRRILQRLLIFPDKVSFPKKIDASTLSVALPRAYSGGSWCIAILFGTS